MLLKPAFIPCKGCRKTGLITLPQTSVLCMTGVVVLCVKSIKDPGRRFSTESVYGTMFKVEFGGRSKLTHTREHTHEDKGTFALSVSLTCDFTLRVFPLILITTGEHFNRRSADSIRTHRFVNQQKLFFFRGE